MKRRAPFYVVCLILTLGLFLAVDVMFVWGFAEEELGFRGRDGAYYPSSVDFPDNRTSTVHDDLTFALAIAAGFTMTASHALSGAETTLDQRCRRFKHVMPAAAGGAAHAGRRASR